jgi:hypothetical protein
MSVWVARSRSKAFGYRCGSICSLRCEIPVAGTCPVGNPSAVCFSPETPITTPDGDRPISLLDVGDLVYTLHLGERVAVPTAETGEKLGTDRNSELVDRRRAGRRTGIVVILA